MTDIGSLGTERELKSIAPAVLAFGQNLVKKKNIITISDMCNTPCNQDMNFSIMSEKMKDLLLS